MKKFKKINGFTLIELVIVIAVIAVLAAVLIPTFTSVLRNAEKSTAMQQVAASYKEALALALIDDGEIQDGDSETVNGFTFVFSDNGANATITVPQDFEFQIISIQNGIVVFGESSVDDPVIDVTGITLNESNINLTVGQNSTLTATVTPNNATDKTVTWTSSDESVATVVDGVVTSVGAGNATITATSGALSANCSVTVTPAIVPVTGITLNESNINLTVGQNSTLTATITPNNATDKTVTWTSSDESVATVVDGIVTSVGAGNVTITATSGALSTNCSVTVTPAIVPVTGITLNESNINLTVGQNSTLTATVTPNNATDKTVTWTSSDESVATVDNGVVVAVGSGNVTITATSGTQYANCSVNVLDVYTISKHATGVTIIGESSIVEGESYSATITGAEHYNTTVTMNGTNITSTAFSNGTISISNVTGNIEITVSAALNVCSVDECIAGSRISGSSGTPYAENSNPGCAVSSYFAVQQNDIVYVKVLELQDFNVDTSTYKCVGWYNSSNNSKIIAAVLGSSFAYGYGTIIDFTTSDWDVFKNDYETACNIRLSGYLTIGNISDIEINIWRDGAWVTE